MQIRGSAEKSRQSFRRRFEVIVKSVQGELLPASGGACERVSSGGCPGGAADSSVEEVGR